MDVLHHSRVAKLKLDDDSWDIECGLLGHLAKIWDRPDSGIWERRGPAKHYVSSKVMTWVAFDRGIKSAERLGFKAPLQSWRVIRDQIHREVCAEGFDQQQNSFVESYGSEFLDASILLLPSVGFLPPRDPRVLGTLAAIERQMMRDGFVLRHDPREVSEEVQPIEGAFLACTLWLADAYVLAGEIAKAQELFDRVIAVANDVGLLAEEFDTVARRQTGNFPQALTHIALISTAQNLAAAEKPATQRAETPAKQRAS
jgi:GH15 family glucan-1,4-alpha-glucosidase